MVFFFSMMSPIWHVFKKITLLYEKRTKYLIIYQFVLEIEQYSAVSTASYWL